MDDTRPETQEEDIEDQTTHVLEEARMVLPGLQALFGFQLIAVFNNRFSQLPASDQLTHLVSLILVVAAIAIIMTPAAYHRQAEPHRVSRQFIKLASRLMTLAMVPLMLGLCLDLYVVANAVLANGAASAALAAMFLALFLTLWFVFPQIRKRP
jgi:Family of unknown function (DUF6328)